ncbi:MAG TPA: DUF2079 domain-containing protein [Chloroflexota bacterium]|nr:DUF2079 domain-containing protein [Chloroflexota bacterium]
MSVAVWAMACLYVVVFCAMSFRRYDAFLMHSLDMGNMEQAIWNTFHGNPFHFTNMRQHIRVEAFGTDTRLSFHVEPILLPLSLVEIFAAGPKALLVLQTLVLASGAFAAQRMARRHLAPSRLAQVAFPAAYLLFPALQAANLYEFHPVTLAAPLLFWALDFADLRRPAPFALFGLAALGTKEEIGLVVALMALWSIRRGMPPRFALVMAGICTAWSLIAVLVIVPAAQRHEHSTVTSSPYLTRYLNRGLTAPGQYVHVTPGDVVRYWVSHPKELADNVLGAPKRGYVQRLLAPVAYLSLLSPFTLLISLPSFLLIIFSTDQHMYGGLGHYSAEFVGIVVGSAILGLAWLAVYLAGRGISRRRVITVGSGFLLLMSVANTRVNGFTPLTATYEWPPISAHVRLTDQMLSLIPPDASVSAQDTLDPHLSDRGGIYLFPDTKDARYVALDVSANPIPSSPDSQHSIVVGMLDSRGWDVLFADDGLLLLRRRATPLASVPALPPAFYTFALQARPVIQFPLRVKAADGLELLGYTISRREIVNLRMPDVVLTMYWRATRPLSGTVSFPTTVTNEKGDLNGLSGQNASALAWLPVDRWKPGQIVSVTTTNMGVSATLPGIARVCLGVANGNRARVGADAMLPLRIEAVSQASGWLRIEWGRRALCVGQAPVIF